MGYFGSACNGVFLSSHVPAVLTTIATLSVLVRPRQPDGVFNSALSRGRGNAGHTRASKTLTAVL